MRYLVGGTGTFTAGFFLPDSEPATLDGAPEVTFTDQEGSPALLTASVDVSHVSGADWKAEVVFPDDAEPDFYRIEWNAQVGGDSIVGFENFELVASGFVLLQPPEFDLRRRLRDQLVNPPHDDGAFFLNDEIHSLLISNNGSVINAAFDGWTIRAAHYSTFVDVLESGSERKMSQMFKQAQAMAVMYGNLAGKRDTIIASAMAGRVVGVVASLRGEYVDTFGLLAVRGLSDPMCAGYVRIFPLHRFMPAVLS